jgi:Outer membrane protein beta-barrel domain
MKAIILTAIFAASFAGISYAQWIHIGPKIGTNINKISGKSFKDEFSYNYSAGGFATIKLGKKWSIQPEVVFNQVSSDTTSDFSQLYKIDGSTISNIKLNYLSIPLLLNYHLSKGIALQAGPQYGILLSQNANLIENGKQAFKKGDFSLLGGVQLQLGAIRVYGRYAVGLNNLNDIDNKDQWKNQSIQLGIGFAIL